MFAGTRGGAHWPCWRPCAARCWRAPGGSHGPRRPAPACSGPTPARPSRSRDPRLPRWHGLRTPSSTGSARLVARAPHAQFVPEVARPRASSSGAAPRTAESLTGCPCPGDIAVSETGRMRPSEAARAAPRGRRARALNCSLLVLKLSSRRGAQTAEMSVAVYCSTSQWLSTSRMGNASRVRPPVPAPTSHTRNPARARGGPRWRCRHRHNTLAAPTLAPQAVRACVSRPGRRAL